MSRSETSDASPSRGWPRWWIVVLILLAVGALTFAAGRFSTFGSQGASPPGTDSPEAGFSRDMQVHHAQAIQMAMEIYRKTSDEELRIFAYDIATGQAGQRGEMYDWLVQWGLPQASTAPLMQWMADPDGGHAGHDVAPDASDEELRAAMGMATDAEMRALRDATGAEADCLFLDLMIRHHEGAIPMAEAVVERGSVPRVATVAQSMIAGQSAEIDLMKATQARLSCRG